MAFVEDLDQFFAAADFGVEAIFTRGTEEIACCQVIFDAAVDSVLIEGAVLATDAPFLLAKTADVIAVRRKDAVALNDKTYKVNAVKDDGTGVSRIDLEIYG